MATLSQFGEQFASKVLERVYQSSVVDMVVNRNYEGEIKKPGDRVNILSFLNNVLLSDYAVGSDMSSETIIDAEDQLIVEKRKYFNFSLDRLEDLFTYAGDIPEALLDNAAQVLAKNIDTYVLSKWGSETAAGNWIGTNFTIVGNAYTQASITTSATGGTIKIRVGSFAVETHGAAVENPATGDLLFGGFENADLYKGVRLRSSASFVSPWYRISAITNTLTADITEWDEATSGSDFEEDMTLRGLFGGDGVSFPKYGDGNASLLTMSALGLQLEAAQATTVSATTIYDQVTLLSERLDDWEVPATDRTLVLPPWGITQLRQASETQPSGIGEIFKGTVIDGKVGRIGAFDVVSAAGGRLSTRAGHSTATGIGSGTVLTAGATGYIIPASHKGFVTFAEKWSESRVVDAENQFAKKYQGLFLFGAKVPRQRRRFGAVLFGNV